MNLMGSAGISFTFTHTVHKIESNWHLNDPRSEGTFPSQDISAVEIVWTPNVQAKCAKKHEHHVKCSRVYLASPFSAESLFGLFQSDCTTKAFKKSGCERMGEK